MKPWWIQKDQDLNCPLSFIGENYWPFKLQLKERWRAMKACIWPFTSQSSCIKLSEPKFSSFQEVILHCCLSPLLTCSYIFRFPAFSALTTIGCLLWMTLMSSDAQIFPHVCLHTLHWKISADAVHLLCVWIHRNRMLWLHLSLIRTVPCTLVPHLPTGHPTTVVFHNRQINNSCHSSLMMPPQHSD